jgi:hypothetical protein
MWSWASSGMSWLFTMFCLILLSDFDISLLCCLASITFS